MTSRMQWICSLVASFLPTKHFLDSYLKTSEVHGRLTDLVFLYIEGKNFTKGRIEPPTTPVSFGTFPLH